MAARPKSIAELASVTRDAVGGAVGVARDAVDTMVDAAREAVDTAVDLTCDVALVTRDAVETAVEVARGPERQRPARMGVVAAVCMAACAGMPADRVHSPRAQLGTAVQQDDLDIDLDLDGADGPSSAALAAAVAALDEMTADGTDLGDRLVLGFGRVREAANLLAYEARSGAVRDVAGWARAGADALVGLVIDPTAAIGPLVPDATRADFSVLAVEPVAGTDSSGYGPRWDPFNGRRKFHKGIDFRADRGTPVMSAGPGKVIKAGTMGGYGKVIIVDHGMGLTTRYGHLSKIEIEEGAFVSGGDQIGRVGATGRATGPHLHFEVRQDGEAINPYLAMQLADEARGTADTHVANAARWVSDPMIAAAAITAAAARR